jgi:ribosomal protein L11 methyltransferase
MPDAEHPFYRTYSESIREEKSSCIEPVHVGRRIRIFPADSPRQQRSGHIDLYLDSSHAFGDGSHPTTILCLSLIKEYLDSLSVSERKNVAMLDIGTGTGVLAMLAAKMEVNDILALDLDPEAVESAKQLAALNGTSAIDFRVMDAALLPPLGTYGLIAANLLPPILHSVIPLAAKLIYPGAPVVVSGIGDSSREEMEILMKESGFTEIRSLTSGWWHAYILRNR